MVFKILYPGLSLSSLQNTHLYYLSYHANVHGWKCRSKKTNYYCNVASKSQVNPFNTETEDVDELEDLFSLVRV